MLYFALSPENVYRKKICAIGLFSHFFFSYKAMNQLFGKAKVTIRCVFWILWVLSFKKIHVVWEKLCLISGKVS